MQRWSAALAFIALALISLEASSQNPHPSDIDRGPFYLRSSGESVSQLATVFYAPSIRAKAIEEMQRLNSKAGSKGQPVTQTTEAGRLVALPDPAGLSVPAGWFSKENLELALASPPRGSAQALNDVNRASLLKKIESRVRTHDVYYVSPQHPSHLWFARNSPAPVVRRYVFDFAVGEAGAIFSRLLANGFAVGVQ